MVCGCQLPARFIHATATLLGSNQLNFFPAVIAVDSAKKAIEFLGLKDGNGKVKKKLLSHHQFIRKMQFAATRSKRGRHPVLGYSTYARRRDGFLRHLLATRRSA
jgi:hypothetical protein